jgi:nicotinamide-nucleotide amidase
MEHREPEVERRRALAQLVGERVAGRNVACAESCTAGIISQSFAAAAGSGDWFRGGIVAYAAAVKTELLHVDARLPLVSASVAEQMARAVGLLLRAEVVVATTGAAGPEPLDGTPAGTVAFAWLIDGSTFSSVRRFDAAPDMVVEQAATAAMETLANTLEGVPVYLSRG